MCGIYSSRYFYYKNGPKQTPNKTTSLCTLLLCSNEIIRISTTTLLLTGSDYFRFQDYSFLTRPPNLNWTVDSNLNILIFKGKPFSGCRGAKECVPLYAPPLYSFIRMNKIRHGSYSNRPATKKYCTPLNKIDEMRALAFS